MVILGSHFNGGYDQVQALAQRYGFDPRLHHGTNFIPSAEGFFVWLPEPLKVVFRSRTGRKQTRTITFPGFYGFIRDWDVGGTYTTMEKCPACLGSGLRPEYAEVYLNGYDNYALSEMPFTQLVQVLSDLRTRQTFIH